MEEFKTWFLVGFDHILNVAALDHILFVLALVVVYKPNMIKQIVILITAFTIGHSITLIISALDLITYDQKVIEFAIPLTIVLTSLNNIVNRKKEIKKAVNSNYVIALVFGLVHGLGFANYLKALLFEGNIVTSVIVLITFELVGTFILKASFTFFRLSILIFFGGLSSIIN